MMSLAAHVLPLLVMVAGALWFMSALNTAEAQYTQPRYNPQPTTYPANQFQPNTYPTQPRVATNPGSIPSIPAAAVAAPAAEVPPADAEASEAGGFLGFPWGH